MTAHVQMTQKLWQSSARDIEVKKSNSLLVSYSYAQVQQSLL